METKIFETVRKVFNNKSLNVDLFEKRNVLERRDRLGEHTNKKQKMNRVYEFLYGVCIYRRVMQINFSCWMQNELL